MPIDVRRLVEFDRRVNDASLVVVPKIDRADLDRPTPCAEWTLRDLLAHMTAQHHGFAAAARGEGANEEAWRVRAIGDDAVAAYVRSVADVTDAFAQVTEKSEFVVPEFRPEPFPPVQAIGFHLVDGIAHGWDVARALDTPFGLDEDVLDAGWQIASSVPDGDFRLQPGSPFGPAVPVTGEAALLDRILGALGRSPDWSPPLATSAAHDPVTGRLMARE